MELWQGNATEESRYRVLLLLIRIYRYFAYTAACVFLALSVTALVHKSWGAFFVHLLGGGFWVIVMISMAKWGRLFIDIAENTRTTAELLTKQLSKPESKTEGR